MADILPVSALKAQAELLRSLRQSSRRRAKTYQRMIVKHGNAVVAGWRSIVPDGAALCTDETSRIEGKKIPQRSATIDTEAKAAFAAAGNRPCETRNRHRSISQFRSGRERSTGARPQRARKVPRPRAAQRSAHAKPPAHRSQSRAQALAILAAGVRTPRPARDRSRHFRAPGDER